MAGTADLEQMLRTPVADPNAPVGTVPSGAPSGKAPPAEASPGLDTALNVASTAMLEDLDAKRTRDVNTFRDVYKAAGSGLWNSISMVAGLPMNLLKWAAEGQAYDLADKEPELGAGALAAIRSAEPYLPTMENINRFGRDIGPDPNFRPETLPGKFTETLMENLPIGMGSTFALGRMGERAIQRGTAEAGKGFLGGIGERYARTSPLGLANQELWMNAAASGGQQAGEAIAHNADLGPVGTALTELGGAVIGGVGSELLGAGVRSGTRSVRAALAGRTEEGRMDLAARLLKQSMAAKDPQVVLDNLRNRAEYVPGVNDLMLPGWAADDIGLAALTTGIAMSKTRLGVAFREAENGVHQQMGNYLKQEAGSNMPGAFQPTIGSPSANAMTEAGARVKPVFQSVVDQSVEQLNERVQLAALEARKGLNEVRAMGGDPRKISAAAAAPLAAAERDARKVGDALYAMLPDVPVSTAPIKLAMDIIDAETKQLGNPDIYPKELAKVIKGTNGVLIQAQEAELKLWRQKYQETLDAAKSGASTDWMTPATIKNRIDSIEGRIEELKGKGGRSLNEFETTDELRAFRSWALELAARSFKDTPGAPANPRLGKFYSQLAEATDEAILKGYMATGNDAYIAAADAANNYWRQYHDHFTRGPVSEILGQNARRGSKVESEAILDKMLVPGRRGETNLEALLNVEKFGNEAYDRLRRRVPAGTIDTPLSDLSEGWLAQHYYDSVTKPTLEGGVEIVPEAHAQFMKQYGKLLDNFPNLQANLDNAASRIAKMQEIADATKGQVADLRDKGKNVLQLFIEADPQQAIAKLKSSDAPSQDARKLVQAAERDPTGRALPALRQMVYEDMLASIRLNGQRDLEHNPMSSGARMYQYMEDNDAILKTIMKPEQRVAMKNVQKQLILAEDAIRTNAVRGQSVTAQATAAREALTDSGTTLQTLIEAAYGGSRALGFFSRTIPFISTMAKESTASTLRAVGEIVNKAIFEDRDLLAALLMRPTENNLPLIRARIRPYFVTPLAPVGNENEAGRVPVPAAASGG